MDSNLARVRTSIVIDGIHTKTTVGEVAKFSQAFGYEMTIARTDPSTSRAQLDQSEPTLIVNAVAALVYLQAIDLGRSAETVLDEVRDRLIAIGVPLDVAPDDIPGIGEGAA
jgi:hypothetical protein